MSAEVDPDLRSEDGQYVCGARHAVDVAYTVSCLEALIMKGDLLLDSSVRGDALDCLLKYLRGDLSGAELRELVEEIGVLAKLDVRMVVELDKRRRVRRKAPMG